MFSKYGPIPASFSFIFILFLFQQQYSFNFNMKKHKWCASDSNPGPQDGKRRQNHKAMAAAPKLFRSFALRKSHRLRLIKTMYKAKNGLRDKQHNGEAKEKR